MITYTRVMAAVFDLFGNEFATQLFIMSTLFVPVFGKRKRFWLRYLLGWAAIAGSQWLMKFGYLPIPDVFNYVLVLVLLFGVVMLSFDFKFWHGIFYVVCSHGVQFIFSNVAYMIIYAVMYGLGKYELFMYYYVEMPIVFASGATATYFLFVKNLKKYDEIVFNSKVLLYCTVGFVAVAIFLTHYARMSSWFLLDNTIYTLAISSLFGVATIVTEVLNIRQQKLERENAMLQELLRKDKRRYEQAKITNEKIMIKYHDISKRKHGGIVDYEELAEMEGDSEILKSSYFTGNPALDVVLSEKALLCERLGIQLICTANGEAMSFMKPHHIYSLVGNALENSIESVRHESDPADRTITLSVTRREDTCVFTVYNYTSRKVEFTDGLPVTDKPNAEEHGFGTRSMRNVVGKYDGQIGFFQRGDTFTVTVALPIPDKADKDGAPSGEAAV